MIKCTKYDLFKKVQFIRHKNILVEYEKKGTINNRVNTVLTNKNINKLILVDKIVCLFYIYFIIQLRDDIILSISYHVFCDDINHAYI